MKKKNVNQDKYKEIGIRIRRYRLEKGLTQQQLSEMSAQSPTYLSHIERGQASASLNALILIAKALEVSLDMLVYDLLPKSEPLHNHEVNELFLDCSSKEIHYMIEILRCIKLNLRKYMAER